MYHWLHLCMCTSVHFCCLQWSKLLNACMYLRPKNRSVSPNLRAVQPRWPLLHDPPRHGWGGLSPPRSPRVPHRRRRRRPTAPLPTPSSSLRLQVEFEVCLVRFLLPFKHLMFFVPPRVAGPFFFSVKFEFSLACWPFFCQFTNGAYPTSSKSPMPVYHQKTAALARLIILRTIEYNQVCCFGEYQGCSGW